MVDRGRGDPRNILGVIIDQNENDSHTVAVRDGVLKHKYRRIDFNLCQEPLLTISDINTEHKISLGEALKKNALGGQVFNRSSCAYYGSKKCGTNRWKSFKIKRNCNSRSHSSLPCVDK